MVVGDWNGHGEVPGCTSGVPSFNAGVDIYMAPDDGKALHKHSRAVKAGDISEDKLDDAVRKILTVKDGLECLMGESHMSMKIMLVN